MNFNLPQINQQQFTEMAARLPDQVLVQLVQQARAQGKKKTTCSREILIDGQLFPSVRAGADFLGVKDSSPLCRALKTTHKYKGHICEYANQQPSDTNSDKSSIEGSTTNG